MAGKYESYKLPHSLNPFKWKFWRFVFSLFSFGLLVPILMEKALSNSEENHQRKIFWRTFFGNFWTDIFNLRIGKQDEKKSDEQLFLRNESWFEKYWRKVMIFNSTPMVNLLGFCSIFHRVSTNSLLKF